MGGAPDFGGGAPDFGGGAPEFGGGAPDFGGGAPGFGGGAPDFGGGEPAFDGRGGAPGRRRFGDLSHLNRDPNREASAATVRGETLDEISNRYIEALGTCQKRISLWNEQDLVRDWQTTQEELRAVQEAFALVIEQRADLEKRQVELLQMRENLLQELEYWRDAPKRGCSIS